MTPEALAAEAAARAAAKERKEQQKREREEREAAAREAAAREKSAEPDDTEDTSLFGDDDNEDMKDFYNNNEPPQKETFAPTSAPRDEIAQEDSDEDLYSSSRSPRRQTQPQPSLQPTVVDDEEENLYSASPPRNRNPPPTAPASNLHLPVPPPPTPHDPHGMAGASPFLFPTMYAPVPPLPSTAKSSFNLVTDNGPVLPPPVPPPTSGRNPGFRVPSLSPSPEAKSKAPFKPATTAPRQFTNPNPRGTYKVPDTPSESSGSHDGDAAGEQQKTTARAIAGEHTTTTATKPAPAQPTQAEIDEEAWAAFTNRAPSPGLEDAMAEWDRDQDEDPGEYEGQSLTYAGDYELETDAGVEVRHSVEDDVRYGDVVEDENGEEQEEDEIDYDYDDDDESFLGRGNVAGVEEEQVGDTV